MILRKLEKCLILALAFFLIPQIKGQESIGFELDNGMSIAIGASIDDTGSKLLWMADKSAFRAGFMEFNLSSSYSYVGMYSTGLGKNTRALGEASASIGNYTTASGMSSIALGHNTKASGNYATAMGYFTTASGISSYAHGQEVTASGDYSTAIGRHVSTNGHKGSIIFGDSNPQGFPSWLYAGEDDQFIARFANGYYLRTSTGNQPYTGVELEGGGNAWVSISDVNSKTNFQPMNDVNTLKKLASVDYSSWNYIGQNSNDKRHYGIMAQDFYRLFGKDNYGTIGSETRVNPIDMMGVVMSALKGASTQIEIAQDKLKKSKQTVNYLKERIEKIEQETNQQDQLIVKLINRIETLEKRK